MTASPTAPFGERVDQLLELNWPTDQGIAARLGLTEAQAAQTLPQWRAQGVLLGCWDPRSEVFRYPPYQFDDAGQVRPEAVALLAVLTHHPVFEPAQDPSGWQKVVWLYTPTTALADEDGHPQSPAARLWHDPLAVLGFIQAELDGSA